MSTLDTRPPSGYEMRCDAIQFAIDTYADNRSRDEKEVIEAAKAYEAFLKEVQNS